MNTTPIIDINRIEFVITNNCTGRCAHCSVGDALNSPGSPCVDAARAAQTVKWLGENHAVDSVMTFGGEPLIYPDAVCAIHSAAREVGIPKRQLITNGYFSKNTARISEVVGALKAAGTNEILLSVDAFHQASIPIEPVLAFAQAVLDSGIYIRTSPAWLVNSAYDDPRNARTKQLIAGFTALGVAEGSGNDIFMAGNAVKNLSGHYPAPALDFSERCGDQPYTSPPTEVRSISIEPSGDVVVCAFVIGNINRAPISDILGSYEPMSDPVIAALMERGAAGLLDIAARRGIDVDPAKCYSVCDICRAINRH